MGIPFAVVGPGARPGAAAAELPPTLLRSFGAVLGETGRVLQLAEAQVSGTVSRAALTAEELVALGCEEAVQLRRDLNRGCNDSANDLLRRVVKVIIAMEDRKSSSSR